MKYDISVVRLGAIQGFSNITQRMLMQFMLNSVKPGRSLEIGVWHGRTALQLISSSSLEVYLVDSNIEMLDISRKHIESFFEDSANVTYIHDDSMKHDFSGLKSSIDFIHIDGQHTKSAVLNDLDASKLMLTNEGVIAIDDFFMFKYPQITEAVYEWLLKNSDFKLFLVSEYKAFICRNDFYSTYTNDIINNMKSFANENNLKCCNISKTSFISDSFTYSVLFSEGKDCGVEYSDNFIEHIANI